MNLTRTRDTGNFYCPTCGTQESYRLRSRRPFLTVYFIPTVPVGGDEWFVQCDACRDHWDPSVLEMDRETHQAIRESRFAEEAVRAMLLVVLTDGQISESEIDAILRACDEILDQPADREMLGELCSAAIANKIEAKNYLLTTSRRWTQGQRRRALQAMFMAAAADGELHPDEMGLLAELRDLFEMTDAEYQAAIEEVSG